MTKRGVMMSALVLLSGLVSGLVSSPVWSNGIAITNARIFTGATPEWAEAAKIEDGVFSYVGTAEGLQRHIESGTQVFDVQGKVVLPGLIDAHTHPGYVASATEIVALPHTGTLDDVFAALVDHVKANPGDDFIIGGYWNTALFDEKGPTKAALDAVVPDRPVMLYDWSGHSQWMNSKALEVLGITRDTPDPVPGLSFFYRDAEGNPTGWAKEFAVRQQMQALGLGGQFNADKLHGFLSYLRSMGVTTLYDAGNSGMGEGIYEAVAKLDREGRLPVRYEGSYHVILPNQFDQALDTLKRWQADYSGDRLNVNTLKIHFDGMSEIGTSGVMEPFIDSSNDNRGGIIMSEAALRNLILQLEQDAINLHIHSMGDRSTHTILNAVQAANASLDGRRRIRITLCHLGLVQDEDFTRFAELDVVASFTPQWHGGWIDGAQYTLGEERFNKMFRVQPLLDDGARVTYSSDIVSEMEWQTHRANPFFGMDIGHNRIEPEWGPEAPVRPPVSERLDRKDLVIGYTRDAAYQLGLESTLGSIEVGKTADLVVLNQSLFDVPALQIKSVLPEAVIMDGAVVSGSLEAFAAP